MDKIKLWWNSRNPRDKRAIAVMLLVAPLIIFWWSITSPLQERVTLARRVLSTKREQATKLMNTLLEYSKIKNKTKSNVIHTETAIMPYVEQVITKLPTNKIRPSISRASIIVGESRHNTAVISFNKLHPEALSKLFVLLAKSKLIVATLELSSTRDKTAFSGRIQVWKQIK